jgi:hypothetical protein
MSARCVVVPKFGLFQVCQASDSNAISWRGNKNSPTGEHYFYRPVLKPLTLGKQTVSYSWNHFPLVVSGDGSLWAEASLWILSIAKKPGQPNMATLAGLATDLAVFKNFLEEEQIDFKLFPKQAELRPTYRFHGNLIMLIRAGETSASTARRQMGTVINFYKWLIASIFVNPDYPPWSEKDLSIRISDDKGLDVRLAKKSTNLAIKAHRTDDPHDDAILDGERLRPLTLQEQGHLIDALIVLRNTEMTLIHLIALFTGARIQTVLTLKVKHTQIEFEDDLNEVPIICGNGTDIDTKGATSGTLWMPRWLYEKLRTYSCSDRALSRRLKAGSDNEEQYLFLTNRGKPYYTDRSDRGEFDETCETRYERLGQVVRQFITDHVIPKVQEATGEPFNYKFHWLRASFGMNMSDSLNKLVELNNMTYDQARDYLRLRMWHKDYKTTERYLKYREDRKQVRDAQLNYETFLKKLADKARNGTL